METIEKPAASPASREARIQSILGEYRSLAFGALEDLMYEAFLDLGKALEEVGELEPEDASKPVPPAPRCGLSSTSLQRIRHHYLSGDLAEWLATGADGDKTLYLRDFLDLNRLQMTEFKARHPYAFTKWTEEQDEALLAGYRQSVDGGRRPRWGELARQFGRNVNAIKLRLEKLGIELGTDTGRPRRSGGFTR